MASPCSTARSSFCNVIGFSRNAIAPNFVASTAVSIVPCPLIMITGIVSCAARAPLLEQRDAVDVGHPDVEQHEVGADALAAGARLRGVLRQLDRVAFVGEDLRQQRADAQFVVDDKNGGHGP